MDPNPAGYESQNWPDMIDFFVNFVVQYCNWFC